MATPRKRTRKKKVDTPPKLTDPELDLLENMENGYRLETDSLGGNPILRRLKEDEVIRPVSVNRNTIKALEQLRLIKPAKGPDPLAISWRLTKKA